MSDSVILGGASNSINNSNKCTIINGANNIIDGKTNSHILGNNIQAEESNAFYVGCNVEVLGSINVNGDIMTDANCIVGGNVSAEGDVIAFSSSDKRLKDNVQPITGCLDKVLSLDAIEFDWNTDLQSTYSGHDIGLIAQQVQQIAPEIVVERDNGYLAMKYEKVIPLLVGATQEQDAKISELEKQIQELIDKSSH